MLVSVLINNYNYSRFLKACIDSVLVQSYPNIEIIVVDDGSTDDSLTVAQNFTGRIKLIAQENTGQGGAYNAGFAIEKGEVVIFLDSDDLLSSDIIARVVECFEDLSVAKAQWRLQLIDDRGAEVDGLFPDTLHSGDVKSIIRKFGNYASPPGSGNAYRKSALQLFFPMQPEVWRIGADTLPALVAPFSGRVVTLDGVGGYYRIHDKPDQGTAFVLNNSPAIPSKAVALAEFTREAVRMVLTEAGKISAPYALEMPAQVKLRLISLKVAQDEHPIPDDGVYLCLRDGYRSIIRWPGFSLKKRLLYLVWLTAVGLSPRCLAKKLILAGMKQARSSKVSP